jgi:exodeoxyribonuclease VII large subunit
VTDLFGRQADEPAAKATEQAPLIVEALLNQIRIERPTGQVLVKGRVERLTAWPKADPRHLFGDLIGSDRSLEFCCPIGQGPKAVGEHVVLSGTLAIRPSPIHQGFAVQLIGEVVGSWTPEKRTARPVILERRRGRVPLRHLVAQHGLEALCLIGSETGLGDARTALLRHRSEAPWRELACKIADPEAIRARFAEACSDEAIEAIAFVRGGSDPLTMQIWNDQALLKACLDGPLPFYTALGHSQELLLADKYSDESFATPTDLGAQAGQIARELGEQQRLEQELAKLTERIGRAEQGQALARAATALWRRWAIGLIGLLILALAVVLAT